MKLNSHSFFLLKENAFHNDSFVDVFIDFPSIIVVDQIDDSNNVDSSVHDCIILENYEVTEEEFFANNNIVPTLFQTAQNCRNKFFDHY